MSGAIQNLLQMVGAVNGVISQEPKVSTKKEGRLASRPISQDLYVVYTGFTFSACHPLGPLTTSNCTCWPSCRLRNPPA